MTFSAGATPVAAMSESAECPDPSAGFVHGEIRRPRALATTPQRDLADRSD